MLSFTEIKKYSFFVIAILAVLTCQMAVAQIQTPGQNPAPQNGEPITIGSTNPKSVNQFYGGSDVVLNTDEVSFTVNDYKINFLGASAKNTDIATIDLYTSGKEKKIATLHFFNNNPASTNEKPVISSDALNFWYPFSVFESLTQQLKQARKLVLVHNKKDNTTYITTDIVTTLMR